VVKRVAGIAAAIAAGLAIGCTALAGLDGDYDRAPEGADGGADTATPDDASLVPVDAPDEATPAPIDAAIAPLVPVAGGYAVGALEVTSRAYDAWLATAPRTEDQPATCAWNTAFAPDATCMMQACRGVGCPEHPQVCVDWCDAFAFCRAVGQRLCGRIGGGAEGFTEYATPTRSQWFGACSSGGSRAFPYGNGYHVAYCNGGDNQQTGCVPGAECRTVIAGSSTRCAADAVDGGAPFDMSGNASEWTDACSAAASGDPRDDACRVRGGSYRVLGDVRLRCAGDAALDVQPRATVAPDVGFRCCSR
jgi:formylglycine-generating enzyme required for sulfatase activity